MRNAKGQFVDGAQGKNTRFTAERLAGNQYAKGIGPNRTSFKKGNTPPQQKPPGNISRLERFRNGRKEVQHTINIDWRGNRKPHNNYKWYLWEVENEQDRPSGCVLYLKNGDLDDIRLENMEVITRGELAIRNRTK